MGRRKIEIQPITHERNRSVTFLKRKNGLFKKAYELGVLCSVDVAVIVFEERPGHHLKLYQYCSTDIQNIVQRHLRYDGEKDTRTPADFVQGVGAKSEDADIENADDDDGDEDTGQTLHGVARLRANGQRLDADYLPPRSMAATHSFPPNPSASLIQRQQSLPQRSHLPLQHRPYEDHHHLPTDDRHASQFPGQMNQIKRSRIGMDSPAPRLAPYNSPPYRAPSHPSPQPSHSHGTSNSHSHQSHYSPYPSFSHHTTSPSFSPINVHPSRERSTSGADRSHGNIVQPHRGTYNDFSGPGGGGSGGPPGSGSGPEAYPFLDDGRRRGAPMSASANMSDMGLEWPAAKTRGAPQIPSITGDRDRRMHREMDRQIDRAPSSSSLSGGASSATATSASGSAPDWLDFLSGPGSNHPSSALGPSHGATSTPPGGVSWERGNISRPGTGGGSVGSTSVHGPGDPMAMDGITIFDMHTGEPKKEVLPVDL